MVVCVRRSSLQHVLRQIRHRQLTHWAVNKLSAILRYSPRHPGVLTSRRLLSSSHHPHPHDMPHQRHQALGRVPHQRRWAVHSDGKVRFRTSVRTRTGPDRTSISGSGLGVGLNRTDGSGSGSGNPRTLLNGLEPGSNLNLKFLYARSCCSFAFAFLTLLLLAVCPMPFIPLLDSDVYTSGRMGSNQSKSCSLPKTIAPRGNLTNGSILDLRFRVLVIGRANTGNEFDSTTGLWYNGESHDLLERGWGKEVRGPNFCSWVWSHRWPGQT